MISFVPLEIGEFEEFIRKQREKGALVKLGPVREKEVVKIDGSSALATLIDVMERDDGSSALTTLIDVMERDDGLSALTTLIDVM